MSVMQTAENRTSEDFAKHISASGGFRPPPPPPQMLQHVFYQPVECCLTPQKIVFGSGIFANYQKFGLKYPIHLSKVKALFRHLVLASTLLLNIYKSDIYRKTSI